MVKHGYQIGGGGLGLTDWRVELPISAGNYGSLTLDFLITTEMYPFADEVSFKKASGWQGVQLSPAALDTEVTIAVRRPRWQMPAPKFYIALDKSAGSSAYDTVIVAKAKNEAGVYCTVKNGQWSEKVYDTFPTEDGPKQAAFQFKVLELSADGQILRMYCPGLNALEGWAFPEGLEQEFARECRGLPLGKTGWEALVYDWIDRQTMGEITQSQHEFLADASYWLLTHKPWDYFITHIHPVDWIYHAWGRGLDPNTAEDQSQIGPWTDLELEIYRQSDWALGRLMEAADMEKTLVVVVSDHGAKAAGKRFKVNAILAKAGLLAYADEGPVEESGKETTLGARPQRHIDWTKTRAYAQRHIHVYLNVKGRDPQGIVEPGEEYEQLREQIIRLSTTTPTPRPAASPSCWRSSARTRRCCNWAARAWATSSTRWTRPSAWSTASSCPRPSGASATCTGCSSWPAPASSRAWRSSAW